MTDEEIDKLIEFNVIAARRRRREKLYAVASFHADTAEALRSCKRIVKAAKQVVEAHNPYRAPAVVERLRAALANPSPAASGRSET